MEKLEESFVFNFSSFITDIKTLQDKLNEYISTVAVYYDELLLEQQDVDNYYSTVLSDLTVGYFKQFLSRPYEPFLISSVADLVDRMSELIKAENRPNDYELICDWEITRLENLKRTWSEFLEECKKQPLLNLDDFNYEAIEGCQVYFEPNITESRKKQIYTFMNLLHKHFPNVLLQVNSIIVAPNSYIELVGGEKTMAFFVEDSLFLNSKDPEDNTDIVAAAHEFGHFIWSKLSMTSHIYWDEVVRKSVANNWKQTRDNKKNSQLELENKSKSSWIWPEEEFSDLTGIYIYQNLLNITDEDYIHIGDKRLLEEYAFVMQQEFNS